MHLRNTIHFVISTFVASALWGCMFQPDGSPVQQEAFPRTSYTADSGSPATETALPTNTPSDSGMGAADSGSTTPIDTGVADTGSMPLDTGAVDAVVPPSDTGSADALMDTSADTTTVETASDTGVADTGSTADSSTDTGTADTGVTDSGAPDMVPLTGTLVLSVRLSRWGSHAITVLGFESPSRPGGATWGSPRWTVTGRGIDITLTVAPGSTFTFLGCHDCDPSKGDWSNAFVDWKTGALKAAMWASYNGKPTARVTSVPNGSGGYNLKVTAAASPLISSTDQDGDGFSPTDPDPKKRDCNDSPSGGQAYFPWQVETPEDSADYDCNGYVDPPRRIIRMSGVSSGSAPLVYDVGAWGKTYAMSWNTTVGAYETAPLEMEVAPREFFVNWAGTSYDSSYWGGVCHEMTGGVTMYWDQDKTLIPVTLKVAAGGGTCHRFPDF